jgi:hypothetical protein
MTRSRRSNASPPGRSWSANSRTGSARHAPELELRETCGVRARRRDSPVSPGPSGGKWGDVVSPCARSGPTRSAPCRIELGGDGLDLVDERRFSSKFPSVKRGLFLRQSSARSWGERIVPVRKPCSRVSSVRSRCPVPAQAGAVRPPDRGSIGSTRLAARTRPSTRYFLHVAAAAVVAVVTAIRDRWALQVSSENTCTGRH